MSHQISNRISGILFVFAAVLFLAGSSQAQIAIDFENENLDDWEVISDASLGDDGPPEWIIRDSELGLNGKVLYQGSNIWGSEPDSCLMGTFIIYKAQQFTNFTLEIDVAADDNDGMGLVWAYSDTDQHYRVIMINDKWPDPNPVDGIGGPFMKIARRISNEEPWYELLAAVKDGYVPYSEENVLHWVLEVQDGVFTFTREDGLSITAQDQSYSGGYVGIQLYAQQAEFDNFVITAHDETSVQPDQKLISVWGDIKELR